MSEPIHPHGEALTAFVDGDLDDDERDAVAAHLAGCPSCATAVAEERSLVLALAALPSADAPDGFYALVLARGPVSPGRARRATRFALANVAAAAAVWLGLVAVVHVTGGRTVRPAMATLMSAHAGMVPEAEAVGSASTSAAAEGVPAALAEYRLVAVRVTGDRRQAVYTAPGGRVLSVFVEQGRLDETSLPAGAEPVAVAGALAWRIPAGADEVVVVERPGSVVTLVGIAAGQEGAVAADAGGSPPRPSVRERVEAAARGLLETFGLG